MKPLLCAGDTVRIKPLNPSSIQGIVPGTLILYHQEPGDNFVAHRVIENHQESLFERGDHAREVSRVPHSAVIGRITHRRRNGVVEYLKFPLRWRLYNYLKPIVGGKF